MGKNAVWLSDSHESNSIIDSGDIVIVCGVSDTHLKRKNGVLYVLHNSSRDDLRDEKYINLQVYTHDVLKRNIIEIDRSQLSFWEDQTHTLYQPWATDLLPNEISESNAVLPQRSLTQINWVGSVMGGDQGNYQEIIEYASLCHASGHTFFHSRLVSVDDNINAIRNSRHAPSLQGKWQVENGYIPCRIFKNISYGRFSETNSKAVSDLLEIDFHPNIYSLYDASEKHVFDGNISRVQNMMKLIKNKHTYVNRIDNILKALRNI